MCSLYMYLLCKDDKIISNFVKAKNDSKLMCCMQCLLTETIPESSESDVISEETYFFLQNEYKMNILPL